MAETIEPERIKSSLGKREIAALVSGQIGARGSVMVLARVKRRLKAFPKSQWMSEEDFLKIVDEEISEWMQMHPPRT